MCDTSQIDPTRHPEKAMEVRILLLLSDLRELSHNLDQV